MFVTLKYKEILNNYFSVENTSLETALIVFDEISSYPDDLLDFKVENALCNSSSIDDRYLKKYEVKRKITTNFHR